MKSLCVKMYVTWLVASPIVMGIIGRDPMVAADNQGTVDHLDLILMGGVENRTYTGVAAIAGMKSGEQLYAAAWGAYEYLDQNADATPVSLDSLFDLASCSKVVATTTAVALLYQRGYLCLDGLVVDYLGDEFAQGGKETITVRHCLLHNAGLSPDPVPWYWGEDFGCPNTGDASPAEDFSCLEQIYSSIMEETVNTIPGTEYVYSDIGFQILQIIVGRVVLENGLLSHPAADLRPECRQRLLADTAGVSSGENAAIKYACYFEAFVRLDVFQYGEDEVDRDAIEESGENEWESASKNTVESLQPPQYLLLAEQYALAVPTLDDTGSSSYTHKRLQGQVADGDCYAAGGLCGHAGVFASARAVAHVLTRWLQVWSEKEEEGGGGGGGGESGRRRKHGAVERHRDWLNSTTVRLFTAEFNASQSSRALGWSTNDPSVKDYGFDASCGNFSASTFMHTGYTGTCVCVDPVNELWSVILTNRAYNCQGQLCPTGSSDAVKAIYKEFNTELTKLLPSGDGANS